MCVYFRRQCSFFSHCERNYKKQNIFWNSKISFKCFYVQITFCDTSRALDNFIGCNLFHFSLEMFYHAYTVSFDASRLIWVYDDNGCFACGNLCTVDTLSRIGMWRRFDETHHIVNRRRKPTKREICLKEFISIF